MCLYETFLPSGRQRLTCQKRDFYRFMIPEQDEISKVIAPSRLFCSDIDVGTQEDERTVEAMRPKEDEDEGGA